MDKIVSLATFNEVFLEKSFKWLNDPEILSLIDGVPVTKEGQREWFNSLPQREDYRIWGLICNDTPIGVMGLRHITESEAEFFCYVGEKEFWGGCGVPIIHLAEAESKSMGIKELWLRVLFDNPRAKKLYDNMGYVEYYTDSKFYYMRKRI